MILRTSTTGSRPIDRRSNIVGVFFLSRPPPSCIYTHTDTRARARVRANALSRVSRVEISYYDEPLRERARACYFRWMLTRYDKIPSILGIEIKESSGQNVTRQWIADPLAVIQSHQHLAVLFASL